MAEAAILAPRTQDELVEHVRAAARDRVPVLVTGGLVRPAHAPDAAIVVSTRGLDRIVAHEPGDLTLTAECGVTVHALQELLRPHRQLMALDPRDPDVATLGGVIAAAEDGGTAARFGPVRDQVLGLRVVNGDGKVTKCGGQVVKNVTGYDLCRLYAGSRGGLGIILEATVRVRPLPERRSVSRFAAGSAAVAFERALDLRKKLTELARVLIVIDEGGRAAVETHAWGSGPLVDALEREAAQAMRGCEALREGRDETGAEAATIVRIATLPDRLEALHGACEPLLTPPFRIVLDVLRGIRESWHSGPDAFRDDAGLDALLTKLGATLDCPTDPLFPARLSRRFPGQTPSGLELMKSLKAALDPAGILNPGMNVFG